MSIFQSIWTIVVFVLFAGIVFWAYSSKHKSGFDEVAHELLEDDDSIASTVKEKHHV
ncbi:MAG: cbb3-type cytochrome c oxidase subunit 3 [Thiotrichaceae bacterium]|nr:cbb3-type cytochrome c oxidase subunit 3 [Thiotrichaceae bacterium]